MELPGPLAPPDWLVEHLGDPGLVVADVRWVREGSAREAFEAGHINGAVFMDADHDLSAIGQGSGRHPLPSPEAFASTMSRVGIGDDTSVVAYDDTSGSIAARLWWMLDATGHTAALLDGGLVAWTGPRAAGPAHVVHAVTTFTPRPWPQERLAGADDVSDALGAHAVVVLDARLGERYRGEIEPIDQVAGHIPGARSAPWADNLDPSTGRFLPSEQLRERYEARGVHAGDDAIVYCGSGLTATHDLLAMRLAGFTRDGRLYGGSWSGWIEDPTRPVATGSSAWSADAPDDR
jgi:thiosulfate/3-mercaptopyruvate sulfurtransferase